MDDWRQKVRGMWRGMLCCVLGLASVIGCAVELWAASEPYAPGEVLVRFRDGIFTESGDLKRHEAGVVSAALEAAKVRLVRWYPAVKVYRAQLAGARSVEEAVAALRRRPEVLYAEPNYLRRAVSVTPDDPYVSQQWGLSAVHMGEAWTVTVGSPQVALAVVDTGMDTRHADLKANVWRNPGEECGNGIDDDRDGYVDNCFGINVIENSGEVSDPEGHGTYVTGIAAAVGDNGVGIAGVAWRGAVMAIKYLGPSGGTVADFLEAVDFARRRGVRVMNLSFGSYSPSQAEQDAIASSTGILFVAAAGNDRLNNDLEPFYPGSYDLPNVISVAASTVNDAPAFFSNYGVQSVHLAAPGVNIVGTEPGDGYETGSGTSAATAFVSGAATLVLSRNPSMSPSEVKHRLLRTADVSPFLDKILTRGRLNVFRALTEAPSGPFIYRILPEKASPGALVTLRGAAFGSASGAVVFAGSVQGEVVSWSDEKIVVTVPQGALSGDVQVRTAQGESPPVWFEVSNAPPGVAVRFAEVRGEAGQKSLLILSNPTDQPAFVTLRLVESTAQDLSLKTLTLSPRQKRFLWLEDLVPSSPTPSLMVECLAETFVGAAVVSVTDDSQRMIAFRPVVAW